MNVARELRRKEHSRPGHELRDATDDVPRSNMDTVTRRFYRCSCGWFGWLTVKTEGGRVKP
ncbi:hypothetical protein SEA_KENREY_247 [Streptomyces phage Kenrey]|nr:hypothetical protein SEA_KENREY_247 [Streptomyces phage Kenrey]